MNQVSVKVEDLQLVLAAMKLNSTIEAQVLLTKILEQATGTDRNLICTQALMARQSYLASIPF